MKKIIKDDIVYNIDGNVVHFIIDEDSRPNWSKILNQHLILNNMSIPGSGYPQSAMGYRQNGG